jgi:hypothetical protein
MPGVRDHVLLCGKFNALHNGLMQQIDKHLSWKACLEFMSHHLQLWHRHPCPLAFLMSYQSAH